MDVENARRALCEIPVNMTVASELRDVREWDENEIEDIKALMIENFDKRAGILFIKNGGSILLSYLGINTFIKEISLNVLGMAFVLYGAILAGYSIRGPYRIAAER